MGFKILTFRGLLALNHINYFNVTLSLLPSRSNFQPAVRPAASVEPMEMRVNTAGIRKIEFINTGKWDQGSDMGAELQRYLKCPNVARQAEAGRSVQRKLPVEL